MCFDLDSIPPIPAIEGGAVDHRDLELAASDGNRFAAFAALPEEKSDVGVVILPDVRGLYRFYEELALRFAERGIAAIAFDFYGRTAGAEKRGEDFDYSEHRAQTTCARPRTGFATRARARSSPSGSASAAATRGSRQRQATV
jgi:carboxymethylenebutenolidase